MWCASDRVSNSDSNDLYEAPVWRPRSVSKSEDSLLRWDRINSYANMEGYQKWERTKKMKERKKEILHILQWISSNKIISSPKSGYDP